MTDTYGLPGHNEAPAYATAVSERMRADYAELEVSADELIDASSSLQTTVQTDLDLAAVAAMIKKLRDANARIETIRVKEKQPYYRAGQAIDAFCKKITDRVERARASLQRFADEYQQRKLAEERRRRDLELAEARRREADALAAKRVAEKRLREAEEAAQRARKPETKEARLDEADEAHNESEQARADLFVANQATEQALGETLQTASKMVGQRFESDGGGAIGMRRTPVVYIEDAELLDAEKLWPFVSDDEKLRALKAWAKTTQYKQSMNGAVIGVKDATVIR
jgi:hypothetical protein